MNDESASKATPPTRKGRRWLIPCVLVILVLAIGLIYAVWPAREPSYQGKSLGYWLERCLAFGYIDPHTTAPDEIACRDALRHMGTNAIPGLLRRIRAHDSTVKLKLLEVIERWDIESFFKLKFATAYQAKFEAALGFDCLGDLGTNAIPALVEICENSSSEDSRHCANTVLKRMYPAAGTTVPHWIPTHDRADWYFDAGAKRSQAGDWSNAILAFSSAIKSGLTNASVYAQRSTARYEGKDYAGALSDVKSSLQLNSSDLPMLTMKGICQYALKDFTNAEINLTIALQGETNDARVYNVRGLARANLRNLDGALEDFSAAINLEPEEASLYRNRALVETLQKEYELALGDFSHSITLNNKDSVAYAARGSLKNALKDYRAAVADCDTAIQLDPKNARAYAIRSASRICLNEFPPGEADLEKALAMDPKLATAYLARAILKAKRDDDSEAVLADLQRTIDCEPKMPEPYLMLGLFQYRYAQRVPALDNCRKAFALRLSRGGGDGRCYIWLIRAQNGETADANRELEGYLQSLPAAKTNDWDASTARFLSDGLTESNFLNQATSTAPRPSAVKGQVCESFYYAGMKRKLAGDLPGARELFQKCIDTGDDNSLGYMNALVEMRSLNGASQ